MASENISVFEKLLREDAKVQAQLQTAAEAYSGNPSDEEAVFEATIGQVAGGLGLPFSLGEAREHWLSTRELSDTELEAVAGGEGYCYIIGGANGVEAGCEAYGGQVGHACAYVGVTSVLMF